MRAIFAVFFVLFALSALWAASITANAAIVTLHLLLLLWGTVLFFAAQGARLRALDLLALLALLFSTAYLFNRDWQARIGWIGALDPIYRALSSLTVRVSLVNINTADAAIGALLPLQLAAWHVRRKAGLTAWPWLAAVIYSAVLFLLGASKGPLAMMAVIAPATLALMVWGRLPAPARKVSALVVGVVALAAVVLIWAGGFAGLAERAILQNRPWLGATRDLALDYWLTGLGFDRYAMALSSYALLINVPFMFYAQNMYLDVWLTQGLVGLFGLAGMCLLGLAHGVNQLRQDDPANRVWRIAALSGLCFAVLYGVVDDPFFEDWRTAPTFFLLLGVLLRANGSRLARRQLAGAVAGAGVAALAFAGAVLVVPALRASWHASLGALRQTQFELSNFREGSDWGLQDALRLARQDALAPSMAEYEAALALDPDNAVANRRLGQIELSLGRYDSARRHLEAAFAVRPAHRSAALLVGESRAVDGDIAAAADAWRGVLRRRDALGHRFNWYYYFVKDEPRAERVRQASELAGESE